MHLRGIVRAGVLCLVLASPASASTQPAPAASGTAHLKAADDRFEEGKRAFASGEYARAGAAFEEADRMAPHPSARWNAARSWQHAGEWARAANLYARYLRDAPLDAPDRTAAAASLAELTRRLARLDVVARELTDLRVDERPADGPSVYVNPGTHLVRARVAGREISRTVSANAGATVSVALSSEPEPATAAPLTPSAASPAGPVPVRAGWSPTVVVVGASVTVVAAAVTIWSGLDTLEQRDVYDRDQTRDNLDEGKRRQLRTNLLIGTTALIGSLTALAGVFMVDWGGDEKRTTVGIGPGFARVRGSF